MLLCWGDIYTTEHVIHFYDRLSRYTNLQEDNLRYKRKTLKPIFFNVDPDSNVKLVDVNVNPRVCV